MNNISQHHQTTNVMLEEQHDCQHCQGSVNTIKRKQWKFSGYCCSSSLFTGLKVIYYMWSNICFENNKSFPLSSCCFLWIRNTQNSKNTTFIFSTFALVKSGHRGGFILTNPSLNMSHNSQTGGIIWAVSFHLPFSELAFLFIYTCSAPREAFSVKLSAVSLHKLVQGMARRHCSTGFKVYGIQGHSLFTK